jgi:hypothetical protein
MSKWLVQSQMSNILSISWREQAKFRWNNDVVRMLLDKHVKLDFYSAHSLKQTVRG